MSRARARITHLPVCQLRRSLVSLAQELARGGAAAWYNPAWLFLNAFYRIFLRISQGASRLQEVLADRWAGLAYGAELFEQGLRHVIDRSVRFQAHANAALKEVVDDRKPLTNLYTYQPAISPTESDLQTAVESEVNAEPSPYDSHPSPRQRLEWVHALAAEPMADVGGAE